MNRPPVTELRGGHLWPPLGALTVLTYNTWLLWRPLNGNAQLFNGYLSELSASDQPHSMIFRGGDLLTGVIVVALGVRGVVLWLRHRAAAAAGRGSTPGRWWLVAALALLVFGTATFFDAFLAMDCSPTLNDQCRVLENSGELSAVHYAHTFTSVGAQLGIIASMVATFIAMVRSHQQTALRLRVVFVICAIEVLALTVMMVLLVLGAPGLGYPQAVMVVVASLWFAAIGIHLVSGDNRVPPDPATRRGRGFDESPAA